MWRWCHQIGRVDLEDASCERDYRAAQTVGVSVGGGRVRLGLCIRSGSDIDQGPDQVPISFDVV